MKLAEKVFRVIRECDGQTMKTNTSESPFAVRPAQASDFDAIASLTNHYIVHTSIHFSYDPVTPAELRAIWEKYLDRYPWFVAAEVGGRLLGYAKAGVWRDRTAYSWTPEVGIYVQPDVHRRGVGRALYGRLLEDLRARGFHSVIGGITLPNQASERLHEAMGFVKVAHFKDAGWKFDAWHDVGFWQVML
jgi:phosphinothricin acetyltransferase